MRSRRPDSRNAFTILELMMVLAVMTIILSLGVPSVARMMARARFKDGVFALQTELSRIRLLSMKSGEAYLFRYMPNTGRYQIASQKDRIDAESAASLFGPEQSLPDNVIFTGGFLSESTGVRPASGEGPSSGSMTVGSLESTVFSPQPAASWSEPILFYPNGRTSNAVIFLASSGTDSYYSEISLRGLTGGVRVSTISAQPPGTPEFPSVLPPEVFAKMNQSNNSGGLPGMENFAGTGSTGMNSFGTNSTGINSSGTGNSGTSGTGTSGSGMNTGVLLPSGGEGGL